MLLQPEIIENEISFLRNLIEMRVNFSEHFTETNISVGSFIKMRKRKGKLISFPQKLYPSLISLAIGAAIKENLVSLMIKIESSS